MTSAVKDFARKAASIAHRVEFEGGLELIPIGIRHLLREGYEVVVIVVCDISGHCFKCVFGLRSAKY